MERKDFFFFFTNIEIQGTMIYMCNEKLAKHGSKSKGRKFKKK